MLKVVNICPKKSTQSLQGKGSLEESGEDDTHGWGGRERIGRLLRLTQEYRDAQQQPLKLSFDGRICTVGSCKCA
jgi:hypothetical protein